MTPASVTCRPMESEHEPPRWAQGRPRLELVRARRDDDAGTSRRPVRAVVVDDDARLRALERTLLEQHGVLVVGEAGDGAAALDAVSELEPDVVLMDINMPRLDGLAAAAALRDGHPHTRIVLHSALADDDLQRRAGALGVPLFDKQALAETIALIARGGG